MITVTKVFKFCYAHKLPEYDGKCVNLHGHNGKLEIEVSNRVGLYNSDKLKGDRQYPGMVIDFAMLKKVVNENIIEELDHVYLNDKTGFQHPTAENIVTWIVNRLGLYLFKDIKLERVRLYEEEDSWAEWRRDVSS